MQTLDTECGFSDVGLGLLLLPGQLSICWGPKLRPGEGSSDCPHMPGLSLRKLPGCGGQAKEERGAGHKQSCFQTFPLRWAVVTMARLSQLTAPAGEKGANTLPTPASLQRRASRSGSVSYSGENEHVPSEDSVVGGRQRTSSHQRAGARVKNCPHPHPSQTSPRPKPHSPSLPHAASFSQLQRRWREGNLQCPKLHMRQSTSQSTHKEDPRVTLGRKRTGFVVCGLSIRWEMTSWPTYLEDSAWHNCIFARCSEHSAETERICQVPAR